MNECPFCEELRKWKELEVYVGLSRKPPEICEIEYGVSLVQRSYWHGEPGGKMTGRFHGLNFCPVCGIPLNVEGK